MNEIIQFSLSALATVVGGYLLFVVKSNHSYITREIAKLGLQITAEQEERRAAIDKEGDVRREQVDRLGLDISKIRERMAYDRGQQRRPFSDSTSEP